MSTLTFDEVESCFPEGEVMCIDGYGKDIVSAQWLHDFAYKVEQLVLAKAEQADKARINELKFENRELRKLLAVQYSGGLLYCDDGELQDNLRVPFIDFSNDSPFDLQAKFRTRSLQSPAPVSEAPSQPVGHEALCAIAEGECIAATEEFFKARPQLDTLHNRGIYEAGFQCGYEGKPTLAAPPHSEQQDKKTDFELCTHPDCGRYQIENGQWLCRAMKDNACARNDVPAPQPSQVTEQVGMQVAQEPKYGIRDNRLFNRASGEFIPTNEPVFIFRARDVHAVNVLASYAREVSIPEHANAVWGRVADFKRFWEENPDQMKQPDTHTTANPQQPAQPSGLPQPSQEQVRDIPWQTMASAWLKGKAAEQAQTNEKYPRHAECYPTWVARVGILQKLAADIEHDLQSQPKQSTERSEKS